MPLNIKNLETKFFANRSTQFLQDIKNFKVPSPEEEILLFEKAKNGDKLAKDKLFMGHQRFIYALAKQYSTNGDEILDYVNEGNVGMSIAFDNFDPSVGVKFITYASHYIRREMNRFLNNTNVIVRQTNNAKFKSKVREIKNDFFKKNGFYPNSNEIIFTLKEKYGFNVKNEQDIYDIEFNSINIDKDDNNYNSDAECSYNMKTSSFNDYEKEIEKESIKNQIENILSLLNERDADIIKMTFGIGYSRQYTFEEIAEKHNLKESSINILKGKILEKLRNKCIYNNVA